MKNTVMNWIDRVSKIAGQISAVFMVLIVILINVEIVLRSIFNTSTFIADEYASYFLVAVVMMGLAYALKEDSHIRVEVIRTRLSQRAKRIVDCLCTLLGIVLAGFVTYFAVIMSWDSFSLEITADSISETPIYLPQLMIPCGLLLFVVQLIATLIRRVR